MMKSDQLVFFRKVLVYLLSFSLLMGCALIPGSTVHAAGNTYYVSADAGDNNNPGTQARPVKTIAKATEKMGAGDTCIIRQGTYRESIIPPADGTTYKSYPGETVTINGCDLITGWTQYDDNIYYAAMDWTMGSANQVFADGSQMTLARFPDTTSTDLYSFGKTTMDSGTATTISDSELGGKDADWWKGAIAWIKGDWCATVTNVTASSGDTLTIEPLLWSDDSTNPEAERTYFICNKLELLNAEREWYVDSSASRLYLWAPGGGSPDGRTVEAQKRKYGIDLTDRSNVLVEGVSLLGCSVRTSGGSSNNMIKSINARYITNNLPFGMTYKTDVSGFEIGGTNNTLRDSSILYSSGNGIYVSGTDNKIINNYISTTDYMGTYDNSIYITGSRHLISYNTCTITGRDCIGGINLDALIIEYNDLSQTGKLSSDLGAIYFVNEDGDNTEIRFNKIHDQAFNAIYLDNCSSGFLVHHNTTSNKGFPVNQPANFHLIYNNMIGGGIGSTYTTYPYQDAYGTRITDNVAQSVVDIVGIGGGYAANNTTTGYNYNAYPAAGQNLTTPPNPTYSQTYPEYRNRVKNPGIDVDLTGWTKTDAQKAIRQAAAEPLGGDDETFKETRCGLGSIRLGGGVDGIEQAISGLTANTTYEYSAWVRVSPGETVRVGVKNYGGADTYQTQSDTTTGGKLGWIRKTGRFTTGSSGTTATIHVTKTSGGSGYTWADDFGIQLVQDNTPPGPLPDGWSSQDIGSVTPAGSSSYNGTTYTLKGAGADIWDTADGLQFAYKPMTGDCTIIARVLTQQNTNMYAKSGVMIRQSLNANSPHMLMCTTPGSGLGLVYRTSAGGTSTITSANGASPKYVKLVRAGNSFSAYYSEDGNGWTLQGTQTISMTGTIYVGLAVCSHANGTINTSTFDNVSVTGAIPAGWSSQDIGSVSPAGSSSINGTTFTLNGAGADIWDTADGLQFEYKPMTGDCTIVARVATQQNTNKYAKAGVMIRQSLNANSPHILMCTTPGDGLGMVYRTSAGGSSTITKAAGTAPKYVKLVKFGNSFSAYYSDNGSSWTLQGTQTINMTGTIYVGLAVCSHANGTLNTSTFDNVSVY